MIRFVLIILLISFCGQAAAQLPADSNLVDLSVIKDSMDITNKCAIYVDTNSTIKDGILPNALWKPLSSFDTEKFIPTEWITKSIYLKFTLENKSDTVNKIYFISGTYVKKMHVFKVLTGSAPLQLKDESWENGYQPVCLHPKETREFIAELRYAKRDLNFISPTIIRDDYLVKYKTLKYYRNDVEPVVGYILSGIYLMMIFFTGANYLQSKKTEYLYNCCYSYCMFFLIFLNTFLDHKSGLLSSLFNEYLDFMLLAAGTIFYIAFTRKFLDTGLKYRLLNKIFVSTENFIIIILCVFTFVVFFTNDFELQKMIENGLKIIVLLIGIAYIVISIAQKDKLMNYLAIGNTILILFSLISFYLILFQHRGNNIFTNSMIYYEIGIVSELIFFLIGLAYKNRHELIGKIKEQEALKLEAEKLSFETKLAVLNVQQKERNRISADMHDDLGAGVTAIRLYSELAKKRIGSEVVPEIEKISSSANELLNNMNAIIWTMSSSNDSLDNMIAYIRSYVLEYFENTGIKTHIQLEENLPNVEVTGEVRRNVFLVVKEALNNILKHSKATEVSLTLKTEDDGLSLYIHDNGIGIDFDNLRRFGNGLINMKKRMEVAQIFFSIENKHGTLIKIHRKWEP